MLFNYPENDNYLFMRVAVLSTVRIVSATCGSRRDERDF